MKITRRKFLKSGSSAAAIGAGALLVPNIVSGQRNPGSAGMLGAGGPRGGVDSFNAIGNLSPGDFEGLIGTQFNLLSDTYGHRSVTLLEVRVPRRLRGSRTESFSLVFEGSEWQDVNQDVYYVSHDSLGYFHALMAPVRQSENSARLCYEAIVNRLV